MKIDPLFKPTHCDEGAGPAAFECITGENAPPGGGETPAERGDSAGRAEAARQETAMMPTDPDQLSSAFNAWLDEKYLSYRAFTEGRLARQPADAEDILQDAALRLWKWTSKNGRTPDTAFAYTVLRNAAANFYRGPRDPARFVQPIALGDEAEHEMWARLLNDVRHGATVQDHGANPACATERADFRSRLVHAFGQLSEREQTVIRLRILEGLEWSAVTIELDVSTPTARTLLEAAISGLRKNLGI